MKKYENLLRKYPEFISLDQLCRVCRIAKRSARYLVEHDIIPSVDTGKKTWRYQIAMHDVVTYLRQRDKHGTMIPAGTVSSRINQPRKPRETFSSLIKPGREQDVRRYFERLCVVYDDVLTVPDIVNLIGLSQKTVLLLLKNGELKALAQGHPRYLVPKPYLLDFVSSPRYVTTCSNSITFKQLLKGFEEWSGK